MAVAQRRHYFVVRPASPRQRLYREHAPPYNYEFELKHKAMIDRLGRYPHRNQTLGRLSSAEEIEFLKQPGSSF